MLLMKLGKVWKCDNGRLGDLRTNILTADHFNKNPFFCMRVHLAMQVVSQPMVNMIDAHAEKCGGMDKYEPMWEIICGIVRLVDICNTTDMSNRGVYKGLLNLPTIYSTNIIPNKYPLPPLVLGCKMIDSPDHEHLDELLQILLTFQKWKKDIKVPKEYIPWQLDEDLC